MKHKVQPIPDFTLNNIPHKLLPFGQAIILVGRVVNKLVKAHNDLAVDVEAMRRESDQAKEGK